MRFGELQVTTSGGAHHFQFQVYLGELTPEQLQVELYAQSTDGAHSLRYETTRGNPLPGSAKAFTYSAEVPASRSPDSYTPRVVPRHPAAQIPLEDAHILWFR